MINLRLVNNPNFGIDIKPSKAQIRKLALNVRKTILDLTRAGKDVKGKGFETYSESYIEFKKKAAFFKGKRGNPNHVNLMFTGAMLRSMAIHSERFFSDIFFSDAERAEIAYYHNEGYGVPKREFFGLSTQNETKLTNQFIEEYWAKIAKEWER